MPYFRRFPLMAYDIKGNKQYKLLPDILRRGKLRATIKSGGMLFDKYDVKYGENPEYVAYKYYDNSEYHWIVLMINNVTDRYYQWPLTDPQFQAFLTDKYGAGNEDSAHHYELVRSSGKPTSSGPSDYSHRVEVNSDETDAITVTNREYEERLQDQKRQIKLLSKSFLADFIEEFDILVRQ